MKSATISTQDIILKQIVSETGIVNKYHQQQFKHQFEKKYSQHVNLVQYHQLREDRFILSQKKVIEKQHLTIQKAKEVIDLKMEKANTNKTHSIIQRSKKAEKDLNRWEKIVQKNRDDYEQQIKNSARLIQMWSDKLSQSSSRKSMRLKQISQTHKQRQSQKQQRVSSTRRLLQQSQFKNPQSHKSQKNLRDRYVSLSSQRNSRKSSRVSTESLYDKKKKLQQFALQKSLMNTVDKQQRINQARYLKQYIQERKRKQHQQKQKSILQMRDKHLDQMRHQIEERNQALDKKFKNNKVKARVKKSSLPQISGTASNNSMLINIPGEQWRRKKQSKHIIGDNQFRPYEHSYDKLIKEKIKDVALLMRNHRRL